MRYACTGAISFSNAFFGQSGNEPILIGDVSCYTFQPLQSSLFDCNWSALDATTCTHADNAEVQCQGIIIHRCTLVELRAKIVPMQLLVVMVRFVLATSIIQLTAMKLHELAPLRHVSMDHGSPYAACFGTPKMLQWLVDS